MKILLTGSTKLQINPPEDRRSSGTVKIDVPAAVVAGLRRLGHDVDWRPVTIGEDLSAYDFAWVSVACPMSTNGAPGALGSFWALSHSTLPAVLFMDDWRATRVGHSQARSLLRDPEKYFFRTMLAPKEFRELCGNLEGATYSYRNALAEATEAMERQRARLLEDGNEKGAKYISIAQVYPDEHALVLEHLDALTRGLQRSYDGLLHTRRVIPMYRWGDPDSVRPFIAPAAADEKLWKLDPSHVVEEIIKAATLAHYPEERQLAWALPLITPPQEFIDRHVSDTTWPIDTVGHRTSAVKKLPTEVDVIEWVSRRSGVFAPCYFGDGRKSKPLTGWWRSRYLYAAACKLPLVAFKGEANPLGDAYTYTYQQIEAMNSTERYDVAHAQSDALRPHYTTRDMFDEMIAEMVGEATW